VAYCTQADIVLAKNDALLKQLAPDGAGGISASIITGAITNADAIIDGYMLSGEYTVPLTSPPGIIKEISVGLAICFLYGRSDNTPEQEAVECARWHGILDKYAKGTMSLGAADVTSNVETVTLVNFYDEDQISSDALDYP